MQIERQDTPDPALRTALLRQLDAHNAAHTGEKGQVDHVSILLRDRDGKVEGGLVGYAWYRWLVVEMLFLPPSLRGHDIGTQLMRSIETRAVELGCHGIWLSTLSFQAPLFYERLGFSRFATLDTRPHGHATIFMYKTALTASPGSMKIEGRADPRDRAVLMAGLNEPVDGVPVPRPNNMAFTLDDGENPGGAWTTLSRNWMFVDEFVLPETLRRQGIGRRLMGEVEAAARERGCTGIWLDTFSFQARPFYEKLGFRVFGELQDYPPGHTRFFLSKHLHSGAPSSGTDA